MLANNADIKLGSYHFLIDSTELKGYQYIPESLYSESQEIQGGASTDLKTANPYILVWTIDDFSGGAEQDFFDEELTTSYWYGEVNPRVSGKLKPTPNTATVTKTQTATLASTHEVFFVGVAGRLWMGCGRDVWYSTDNGVTFSQHNGTALFGAGYTINGMTDDGNFVWVTASNGTTRKTTRIDSVTASTTVITDVTSTIRATGMGRIEGKVYVWTGGHLYEYDSQDEDLPSAHLSAPDGPVPSNIVHQPHAASPSGTFGTDFFSGIASTDTSVVYFLAASGKTIIYEFKYNAATNTFAGRKIWEPPSGFTATHLTCSMGVIYVLGTYGGDVALLSMSLANRDPQILTYVGTAFGSRAGATLTPRFLTGSYGASVFLGVSDGTTNYTYIYDAEVDALSELDRTTMASDGTMQAGITIGNKRVMASHAGSGTSLKARTWADDNAATTSGTWTWVSSAHHFRYPYDEKLLTGIQVVQDPAQASGTVQVEVQLDENGVWISTDADAATMTTTAGVKATNFELSDEDTARKFNYLRLRVTGAGNANLFNITPRAYINAFQEKWILRIRLDDEVASLNSRGSNRQVDAQTLASYIRTLVNAKNPVEFRDGYRFRKNSDTVNVGYSKHVVVLEFPDGGGINLERVPGTDKVRGYCDLVLRSIQPV